MATSMQPKVVLVTGAGSGIGLAVAKALLEDGHRVALTGRRPGPLEELATAARAAGHQALALPADVRVPEDVERVFAQIEAAWGRLDVLFNNAGVNAPAVPMDELPVEQWRNVVDTNVTGVYLCARAAFALMKRQRPQGGRIINNGSISAHAPRPFSCPYTASKHAVLGLTKCIALDGRAFNITASQIDIGNALTKLSSRMTHGVLQANGSLATEPMMDVADVAHAVRFMCGLPPGANVLNMTLMASQMPFVGRG